MSGEALDGAREMPLCSCHRLPMIRSRKGGPLSCPVNIGWTEPAAEPGAAEAA